MQSVPISFHYRLQSRTLLRDSVLPALSHSFSSIICVLKPLILPSVCLEDSLMALRACCLFILCPFFIIRVIWRFVALNGPTQPHSAVALPPERYFLLGHFKWLHWNKHFNSYGSISFWSYVLMCIIWFAACCVKHLNDCEWCSWTSSNPPKGLSVSLKLWPLLLLLDWRKGKLQQKDILKSSRIFTMKSTHLHLFISSQNIPNI